MSPPAAPLALQLPLLLSMYVPKHQPYTHMHACTCTFISMANMHVHVCIPALCAHVCTCVCTSVANMYTCRHICTSTSLMHTCIHTYGKHSPARSPAHLWQTRIPTDTHPQEHPFPHPHRFSHPSSVDLPSVRVPLPILFPHHEAEGEWARAEFHFNHLCQEANVSGDNDDNLKCC